MFDEKENQWYEGAVVVDFDSAVYSILWVNGETTAAEPQFVKAAARKRVEWKRVPHEKPFSVSCKKAAYREYYSGETDPTVDVLCEPPEPPMEDHIIEIAEPEVRWVAPSRKNSEIPDIAVEQQELPTGKKVHGWQRRVAKFEAKQKKKNCERPSFDTRSGKQKGWSSWESQMPPLAEKAQRDPYARYAGRFAPEEEEAPLEIYEPAPKMEKKKQQKKKKKASPMKESAVEEAVAPTIPAVVPEVETENQPSESPVRLEQKEEVAQAAPAAAAPAAVEEDAVMSEKDAASEAEEDLTIPTGDHEQHLERRTKLFSDLAPEEQLPLSVLKAEITKSLSISDVYDQGVSSAYSVAKDISQENDTPGLTRLEFRVFLISFSRYISLYDLFGESLKGEEGTLKKIEPEEFEKAVPLLSQWGAEMADIEEAFTSDSSDSQVCILYISY